MNDGGERHGARVAAKDLCIESVRLRLEDRNVAGLRSTMGIARLLGQDEVLALMEEEATPRVAETVRPAMRAPTAMMSGDEINAVLRLRRHAR